MGLGRTHSLRLQCPTILPLSNPALKEYTMRSRLSRSLLLAVFLFPGLCKGEAPNRVTILYDAFGKSAAMTKAWGFSALVEFGGKRILFDTGGESGSFFLKFKTPRDLLVALGFVGRYPPA